MEEEWGNWNAIALFEVNNRLFREMEINGVYNNIHKSFRFGS